MGLLPLPLKPNLLLCSALLYSPFDSNRPLVQSNCRGKRSKERKLISKMESSDSQVKQMVKWAINLEGRVVEIPEIVIDQIRACPTTQMGGFFTKQKQAWRFTFPLSETSARMDMISLLDLIWVTMINPWWKFSTNTLRSGGRKEVGVGQCACLSCVNWTQGNISRRGGCWWINQ